MIALTSLGAHHGICTHACGRHGDILGVVAGLLQEGLLLGFDGCVHVDGGVRRLCLRYIIPLACRSYAGEAGKCGRGVATRGNAEGLPRNGRCNSRHDGIEERERRRVWKVRDLAS